MINIHLNATFPRRTGGHALGVHGRSVNNYRYHPSLWLATDETGGPEAQGVASQCTVKMIKVSPKYPQRGIGQPGANGPIKNNQHFQGFLVARAGVQPATFALGVRCSMQLSYRAMNQVYRAGR